MFLKWIKSLFGPKEASIKQNQYDFVAIDFETANNNKASICSCGIVAVKDGQIVDSKHFLVRPKEPIFYKRNIQIHGIKKEDVMDKDEFDVIWPTVKKYIDGGLVIAHNASFDMGALRAVLSLYKLDYPNSDYICTVYLARKTVQTENHKLNTLAQHFNIELNHHDALSDAKACATLATKICEQENASLAELVHRCKLKVKQI